MLSTITTKEAITDINGVGLQGKFEILSENVHIEDSKYYIIRDADGTNNTTYIVNLLYMNNQYVNFKF